MGFKIGCIFILNYNNCAIPCRTCGRVFYALACHLRNHTTLFSGHKYACGCLHKQILIIMRLQLNGMVTFIVY